MRAVIATPLAINQGIAKYYASRPDEAVTKVRKQARKRFKDLTEDEQHERKQLGWIIMCWGFVVPVMIDQFLLKSRIPWRASELLWGLFDQFMLSLIVPWVVIWWVLKIYWK